MLDRVAATAAGVASSPAFSAEDRALAQQMLANLPDMRNRVAAGYGTLSSGAVLLSKANAGELETAPMHVVDAATAFHNGDEIAAFMEAEAREARAGYSAWGVSSTRCTIITAETTSSAAECTRKIWDWARSVFYFGSSVVGVAVAASATGASAGLAVPGLLFAGSTMFWAGENLYYANSDLIDCVVSYNSQPHKP